MSVRLCPTCGGPAGPPSDPPCTWGPKTRLEVDERPRCEALGRYEGQAVPCDLPAGHKGKHEWTGPTGQEWKEWR